MGALHAVDGTPSLNVSQSPTSRKVKAELSRAWTTMVVVA